MMALEHLAAVPERVSRRMKQSLYPQKHMSGMRWERGHFDVIKCLATATKAEGVALRLFRPEVGVRVGTSYAFGMTLSIVWEWPLLTEVSTGGCNTC
jgi:hypothetical protein